MLRDVASEANEDRALTQRTHNQPSFKVDGRTHYTPDMTSSLRQQRDTHTIAATLSPTMAPCVARGSFAGVIEDKHDAMGDKPNRASNQQCAISKPTSSRSLPIH